LNRHIKVYKESSETKLEEISRNNPFAEEVIYRALGTSIYEIIEPYILIFEGSSDKEMYDAFMNRFSKEGPTKLKTIAATGVQEIRKYLKFFNQKTITGIVLVDSDQDGKEVLRVIKERDKPFERSSFEILDIVKIEKEEATLEDLLPIEIIKKTFFEMYDRELSGFNEIKPLLFQIKEFKAKEGITGDHNLKEFKIKLIEKVMQDLEENSENIKDRYEKYYLFFKNLNKTITGIQTLPR
jgi:hypothetical protein